MQATFAIYLLRVFLARALLALAGLTVVLAVFDTLANLDKLVDSATPLRLALPAYMTLRLPEILSLLIPLAALLGALATVARLVAGGEMAAIRAAGVSGFRIARILLLGAGLLAVAQFALADLLVPEAAARLRLWAARAYAGLPPLQSPRDAPNWIAVGDAIVHIAGSSADGTRLDRPIVIDRDATGRLSRFLTARTAHFDDGLWVLHDVHRPLAEEGSRRLRRLPLDLPLHPARFSAFADDPAELTFADLLHLQHETDLGQRSVRYYRFWTQRKLAQPAGSLVMVLLVAPLALQLARRDRIAVTGLAVLAAGFLYLIIERLLIPPGESGILPLSLAAWAPAGVFASLALWPLVLWDS